MITVQQRISAILDTPVFNGNLHYIRRPDPDGKAASVVKLFGEYSIVGGQSFQSLEGDVDTQRLRIRISIYSVDAKTLLNTASAVETAMKAANELTDTSDPDTTVTALFNYSAMPPIDGYEDDTRRFVKHMDYYVWD